MESHRLVEATVKIAVTVVLFGCISCSDSSRGEPWQIDGSSDADDDLASPSDGNDSIAIDERVTDCDFKSPETSTDASGGRWTWSSVTPVYDEGCVRSQWTARFQIDETRNRLSSDHSVSICNSCETNRAYRGTAYFEDSGQRLPPSAVIGPGLAFTQVGSDAFYVFGCDYYVRSTTGVERTAVSREVVIPPEMMITVDQRIVEDRLSPQLHLVGRGSLYSIPENQVDYSGEIALMAFWPKLQTPLSADEAASPENSPERSRVLCRPEFGSSQNSDEAMEKRDSLYSHQAYTEIVVPQRILEHLRQ